MNEMIVKWKYLILAIVILMIVGCAEPAEYTPDTTQPDPTTTEPTAIGLTRVISQENVNVGDVVNVKLYINLGEGKTYYIAEETVPNELEVLDKEADKNNHLKLINIQNPTDKVYEYNVKANSPGSFTFSGVYAFDGIEDPVQIMGQNTITVK